MVRRLKSTILSRYLQRRNAYFRAMETRPCSGYTRWYLDLILSRAENYARCATYAVRGDEGWEKTAGKTRKLIKEAEDQIAWLDYLYKDIFKEKIDAHL